MCDLVVTTRLKGLIFIFCSLWLLPLFRSLSWWASTDYHSALIHSQLLMSESKHSLISKHTIHLDKHLIIRFLSMPLNLLFTNVFIYARQTHSCFLQHTYTIEYRLFGVLRVKGLKFWSFEKFEALKFLSVKSPKIFGSINMLKVYNWSDCKGTRTHNHLVRKRTRKHQPNKSNGRELRSTWLWIRILLQSLKFQMSCLFWTGSFLAFRQLQSVDLL